MELEVRQSAFFKVIKEVVRRRKMIAAFLIALSVVSAIGGALIPKKYEISAVVEIGKKPIGQYNPYDPGSQFLEYPSVVSGKIKNDVYGKTVRKNLAISEAQFSRIQADYLKDSGTVILKTQTKDTELAIKIINGLAEEIVSDHKEQLAAVKADAEARVTKLNIQLAEAKQDAKVAKEYLVRKNFDIAAQLRLERVQQIIWELERQISDEKAKNEAMTMTKIADAAHVLPKPVTPSVPLIVLLALCVGASSIFAATAVYVWWRENEKMAS